MNAITFPLKLRMKRPEVHDLGVRSCLLRRFNILSTNTTELKMVDIGWLLNKLWSVAPALMALKKEDKALAKSALSSAITETSIYFSHIKDGGEKDQGTSLNLSSYAQQLP
jgi:hypothetical protein